MDKVTIVFTQDVEVKDGTGTKYKAGQKETMNQASANHWLSRGKAISEAELKRNPDANAPQTPTDDVIELKKGSVKNSDTDQLRAYVAEHHPDLKVHGNAGFETILMQVTDAESI